MQSLVVGWYGWLSAVAQGPVLALQAWADQLEFPLATVVLLGLIGAMAPCQLTTNLGALAYASAHPGGRRPLALTLAYVAGKISVYTLAGGAMIVLGLQLQTVSILVVIAARKALGPLMIVVALGLLGVWRLPAGVGQGLAWRLHERLRGRGVAGAYLLGVAFSFAFCPTLFWLFFGITIPLGLRSAEGWTFPGLFALGSSLPLLALAGLVTAGVAAVDAVAGRLGRVERALRRTAGVVLVLAGLHDPFVYWVL